MQKYLLWFLPIVSVVLLNGCDSTTGTNGEDTINASEEKQFVWNGLNTWYFWQAEVPDLADSKKQDNGAFSEFLNGFSDEQALFDHLIFREDDFSWFIPDFEVHEAARVGTSKSFGMRFQLLQLPPPGDLVIGYIQYIVPNSPAAAAGLERGDIFNKINNRQITVNNFPEVLQGDVYDLTLANLSGNFDISETGEVVTVQAVELTENPVHTSRILDVEGKKVGYLLYNAFRFNFHEDLNDVFGEFAAAGIDELVLDLRYNGGGAVVTSAMLGGMISGLDETSIFAQLLYNDRQSSQNRTFPFFSSLIVFDNSGSVVADDVPMNKVNMSRIYVLTSRNTASASETLINSFKPFGIETIIIGETTRGKDEGSITVYDAPEANYSPSNEEQRAKINPNHKRAMQPIVFKIFNQNREDYPDGFVPDFSVRETDIITSEKLPPIGDPADPLLSVALNHIQNGVMPAATLVDVRKRPKAVIESTVLEPFHDEFYLLPGDFDRMNSIGEQQNE